MPARRLPWVKLWPELMEREKVRQLSDSQYRTWTYCLMAGSQQPTRWRFDSLEHAAYVTRRPLKDVRALAEMRFLDVRADGTWIHDADEYQDVAPSDVQRDRSDNPPPNDTPTPPEPPTNGRETAAERSANGRTTLEQRSLEREREKETGERDEDESPPDYVGAPPLGKRKRMTEVDATFRAEMEAQFGEMLGSVQAVQCSIDAALSHKARLKYTDLRAYVRNWLRTDASRGRVVPLARRPADSSAEDRDGLPLGRRIGA